MFTPIEVLCKSYTSDFTSYFHYFRTLRCEDKPDYSYMKRLFRGFFIHEGNKSYIGQNPQISSSSRGRITSGIAGQNAGTSTEKPGRTSVVPFFILTPGQDIRDRLTGAADPLSRRNLSAGVRHELSRNRTSENVPSSKYVVLFVNYAIFSFTPS
ncbi:casein kinase 1-like protein 10 [Artemisia annua]|uniref:Casein kinase 1-like protein 10 n=1 Tax=Artemisia annua TaxID=35608 RepID=A0A2U1KTA9_ARTAN|nr:casein kinase 1-like protein 10 [Artemisia annua]